MSQRNRRARAATAPHQHRQVLLTVLYCSGIVLLINAWLISRQAPVF
jgi:hypothetical protein